jgi:hypothetical protein
MAKVMTRSEAETKRQKAIKFLRRMGKGEDAERFEAMSPEEYAGHKGAQLLNNPNRRETIVARQTNPTKGELSEILEQIEDLAEEALDPELTREELVSKVKELADLASGELEEEEDGETDSDSDTDEDDDQD